MGNFRLPLADFGLHLGDFGLHLGDFGLHLDVFGLHLGYFTLPLDILISLYGRSLPGKNILFNVFYESLCIFACVLDKILALLGLYNNVMTRQYS